MAKPDVDRETDMSHAALTLDEFNALALAWRTKAGDGDPTTCRIAEALDSVLRRRRSRQLLRVWRRKAYELSLALRP